MSPKGSADAVADRSPLDLNVRRDLLTFIEYVQKRGIKRSHRENRVPPADLKRLVKLLQVPEPIRDVELEEGYWAEWLSTLALELGLVTYDTKGVYAGYTSESPVFPDNHMHVDRNALAKYLALSSTEKERRILAALIEVTGNEFYDPSMLGTQERFHSSYYQETTPNLMNLPKVRRRLLEMLESYPVGQPVPFTEFLERVQRQEPDLILARWQKAEPKTASKAKRPAAARGYPSPQQRPPSRYGSLHEYRYKMEDGRRTLDYRSAKEIQENEPNAFYRGEGRYLAYFLEEIPVLMQFVQLQYAASKDVPEVYPPLPDFIESFTVTERLAAVLDKHASHLDRAKVTITPDFHVLVEAPLYPDTLLAKLAPYATLQSTDRHTHVLELSRAKTVETLTSNPAAPSLSDVLAEVAAQVPRNVTADIAEWMGHAEKITVYEGVSLVEILRLDPDADSQALASLGKLVLDVPSPRFAVVGSATKAFNRLEALERVPTAVSHPDTGLVETLMPHGRSAEARGRARSKPDKALPEATWVERGMATYISDNRDLLQAVASELQSAGVAPVLVLDIPGPDRRGLLVVPDDARTKVNALIRKLRSSYRITLE